METAALVPFSTTVYAPQGTNRLAYNPSWSQALVANIPTGVIYIRVEFFRLLHIQRVQVDTVIDHLLFCAQQVRTNWSNGLVLVLAQWKRSTPFLRRQPLPMMPAVITFERLSCRCLLPPGTLELHRPSLTACPSSPQSRRMHPHLPFIRSI